jgi:hypothetical protein
MSDATGMTGVGEGTAVRAHPPGRPARWLAGAAVAAVAACLAGCANTAVTLRPSPQAPVCDGAAAALVLWATQWRRDQKDVPEREAAADAGLRAFLQDSGCFARAELRRADDAQQGTIAAQRAAEAGVAEKVVLVTVRELGPVVRLLSSVALVEGGTEVVLQVEEFAPPRGAATRAFTIHWQRGGAGVVSGVASLPEDMRAALVAGLQPRAAPPQHQGAGARPAR